MTEEIRKPFVATHILRQEHETILLALQVLHNMCDLLLAGKLVKTEHLEKIVEFIKTFADACHHAKEEEVLFPAMEGAGIPKEGGPLCVMLMEHQIGREYVKGMSNSLLLLKKGDQIAGPTFVGQARAYIDLLMGHIGKENDCLFPMAEKVLDTLQQISISEEFERVEIVKIGRGKKVELIRALEELKRIYFADIPSKGCCGSRSLIL